MNSYCRPKLAELVFAYCNLRFCYGHSGVKYRLEKFEKSPKWTVLGKISVPSRLLWIHLFQEVMRIQQPDLWLSPNRGWDIPFVSAGFQLKVERFISTSLFSIHPLYLREILVEYSRSRDIPVVMQDKADQLAYPQTTGVSETSLPWYWQRAIFHSAPQQTNSSNQEATEWALSRGRSWLAA